MKQFLLAVAIAALMLSSNSSAQQCSTCGSSGSTNVVFDADGRVQPQVNRIPLRKTLRLAVQDRFSPNPLFSNSTAGVIANQTHTWNQDQANVNSWHGGYNYWKYQSPTALVVPPTASYITSYGWGVGQVRSTPIHHQFGRGAGSVGGASGAFSNTPYHPYNTNQFGVYPVRGAW